VAERRFALVLSGGGLKGLAHIGVFQALAERGLTPDLVVGSSMGSLVAAAWASGMSVEAMRARAMLVHRKDVFRVAHADMAFRRMLAPAIYRREPLDLLIDDLVGRHTFDDLPRRLIINTVDVNSGMQVLWGAPGLRDVPVGDAVFASCALPGIFPPREIRGRYFCDGAVVSNLPVRVALALGRVPVIAVDVGATTALRASVEQSGFAATYVRGLEIVMQTMQEYAMRRWEGQAVLLVEPRVEHVSMFSFEHTREMIEEGHRATSEALDQYMEPLFSGSPGIYPQRVVQVEVDRDRCIGCGACMMRAPGVFVLDEDGKAAVRHSLQIWSPGDGDYVRNCPTYAITAKLVDPGAAGDGGGL